MSVASYLLGCASLAIAVAALAFASTAIRRALAPGLHGPDAWLAGAVIGIATLILVLEVLGTVGLLRPNVVRVTVPLVALALGALASRRAIGSGDLSTPDTAPSRPQNRVAIAIACGIVLVVVAQWVAQTGVKIEEGIRDFDSLRYHQAFSVRWVQRHTLLPLVHTSAETQETFFPGSSELTSAYGMLLFGRDVLTQILNLAWLALALLGAWCAGRRLGSAAVAVAGVAALCSTPLLASIEPGTAKNDIAALALLLAATALLLVALPDVARGDHRVLALAGATAGLAAGAMVTIGRRSVRRAVPRFVLPALLTGGFWYLRNLLATGNPLPWLRLHVGPLALPGPAMPGQVREGFTVLHYAGSLSFWTTTVPLGLVQSFGVLFPVIVGAFLVAAATAVFEPGRNRAARLIGIAALVAVAGYLVTPFGAGGPEGDPFLFPLDLRFLAPALALAAVASSTIVPTWPMLGAAAAAVAVDQVVGLGSWSLGSAVVLALVVGALGLALAALARSHARRGVVAIGGAAVTLAALVWGWQVQHDQLSDRYEVGTTGRYVAYRYFADVEHARVAVGGFADDYPFVGVELSNWVQFIGVDQPHGGFRPAATCREWMTALRAGRYDYVVLSRSRVAQGTPPETAWTATDPSAQVVLHRDVTTVFRLHGLPSPATCPRPAR
ncbi:MAG: hypothetical protein QOI47_1435 [Actinomycetota bacterium]|nr:hypothetical protein [Actinomycetota bacterium]